MLRYNTSGSRETESLILIRLACSHSSYRSVGADFHRRHWSLRDRQYEIHAEWGPDHRDYGWGQRGNGRRSWGREPVHLWHESRWCGCFGQERVREQLLLTGRCPPPPGECLPTQVSCLCWVTWNVATENLPCIRGASWPQVSFIKRSKWTWKELRHQVHEVLAISYQPLKIWA